MRTFYKSFILNTFCVLMLSLNIAGQLSAQYSPDNPAPLKEWTFLIYIDGDNDLEEYALNDFIEMSSIGSNIDINIVVMLDRISSYSSMYDNWTDTRRGYVQFGDTPGNTWGESLGEINMGDPQNLKDFISWGSASFPSNRTVLVLWNHGNGWSDFYASLASAYSYSRGLPVSESKQEPAKAICLDDTSGDELTLAEIRIVLEGLRTEELITIEAIGMDACLMAMIEVIAELKDVADYFVGSPAEEPVDGWPYDTIFQDLQINPYISTAELGEIIVNRYYQSYSTGQTQVAIDLSGVDSLLGAIDNLSYGLAGQLSEQCISDAANVQAALDDMIVAEKHGSGFQGANGLSINLPTTGPETDYNSSLLQFVDQTGWKDFLASYPALDADSWIRSSRSYSYKYGPSWNYFDIYSFCDGILEYAPVGIYITPVEDFVFFGHSGGPFSEPSTNYQVTNTSSQSIDWDATVAVPWLIVSPFSGTLAAGESETITVSIDVDQTDSLSEGVYYTTILFNDSYNQTETVTIKLACGYTNHLTEIFTGSEDESFDLYYKTMTFTPADTEGYYSTCIQDASDFEVDPASAAEITLSDDDTWEISLAGNYLPFFGELYNSVFVGSNGYLTFTSGDTKYSESISNHFNLPRISAFFDDLSPVVGVTRVSYLSDSEKLVVTYESIGEIGSLGNQNSFQIQLFFNGIIKITWLEIATTDALVGLSGGELPNLFEETNLSHTTPCQQNIPVVPIALDSHISMFQGFSKNIVLSAYDDGLPQGLEYVITMLPTKGKLYIDDLEITSVPYSLGNENFLLYQAGTSSDGVDYFNWYSNDGENDSNIAVTTIEIMPAVNYFTESFLAGESDLSRLSTTFTPDDSVSGYSVCIDSLIELPNDPNAGTRILHLENNNDDEYQEIILTEGKQVYLYGQTWSSFYVSANGVISFGSGTSEFQFTFSEHFSSPKVSMFFVDLNPDYGGTIFYQQLDDKFVISFNKVRDRDIDVTYTFQTELYFDGMIKIHWLDVDGNSALAGVGLSEGNGEPSPFVESDLSLSNSCINNNPVAQNSKMEVWAGQSSAVVLQAQFADEYVISSLPLYGSLYVGQTIINSVPFGLGSSNVLLYTADRDADSIDQFEWYCYDSTSDMMAVSNTASVDILIHSCDYIIDIEPVFPVDQNECSQVNLPLMWDVPIPVSKSKIKYTDLRSLENQESILQKQMSRAQSQQGPPTISDLPTKAFVDIPDATVNVLMFVKYANNAAGGEVENTLNAVSQYYKDFSVTLTDEEDPILLGQLLSNHQVFVIPEQQNTIVSVASALGESWSDILTEFVERGGVVVACDYIWGAYELLNSAGLMQVQASQPSIIFDVQLEKQLDNLITEYVDQSFVSSVGAVAYDSTDSEILVSYQGKPVAVASYFGHGMTILLGWDYYSYDDSTARIIANAVRLGAADLSYDIYLDTVNPPLSQVAQGYRFKIFDPGILVPGQEYFWQVDVSNNCGDYISGPIWSFTTSGLTADFDGNCRVDLSDMSYLAVNWLNSDCSTGWFRCDGTDIDRSGDVGFEDLAGLAEGWLSSK